VERATVRIVGSDEACVVGLRCLGLCRQLDLDLDSQVVVGAVNYLV
jgi:hypothetical protein